jgi:STE24 endopeptidase
MHPFSYVFLGAVAAGTLLQLWLLHRQLRHVAEHRSRVPARFAGRVSLQQHHKAADYTRAKGAIGYLELALGLVLILGWTLGGGLDALAGHWSRLGWDPRLAGLGLFASFFLIMWLIELPLTLWRTFRLEARFGFNRTTPKRFVLDQLLGLSLSFGLGAPLVWAVLTLMERAGELWWLWVWTLWLGFVLLMSWAYPVLIAPLFNKFTPLGSGELRQRIEGLLRRSGFSSRGIFVMDGSRRSGHGNAYFTGFGRNKRIVFFDTLVEALDADEIEAVLAHELGHFKRRHVLKRLSSTALLSLLGLALLAWLIRQPWFFSGLGVGEPSDAQALLLFLLVAPVFSMFFRPLGAYLSRRHEFEADDFAISQSGGQPLIQALVKLYRDNANTLTPDPVYSFFHDSHPPAPVRVAHISDKISPTSTQEVAS